ncbi:MAG: PTS system mannose/fructose/sorbose family transporter subunit IID [Elusimicrobia bacterium]|nr:PTS system mannose/fructose/sorbose family transporter subunit IID [Elusimicrobiota bacterium]
MIPHRHPTLFSVWWRSFLIQAVWNMKGRQHLGFAFAITPWLRRLAPDPRFFQTALRRHLACFGTHPYMVNILLGIVCALEEARARTGRSVPENTEVHSIEQIKATMAGPLAAIGDHVIWATWRPWTVLMGVAIGLVPWASPNVRWPVAVGTFLGLYNVGHLVVRVEGLWQGYHQGTAVVAWLSHWHLQRIAAGLRQSGVLISVVLILSLLIPKVSWRREFFALFVFGTGFWMARRGRWGTPLFYLVLLLGFLGALFGV